MSSVVVSMKPEVLKLIDESLHRLKAPAPTDKVYKDECMFSFDTPVSKTEEGFIIL
jgi:hypothetical protein